MERLGMEEGEVIEHTWLSRAIENAQKRVEGHNFDIRKNLLEYDDVMNQQRKTIYKLRRQVLAAGRGRPAGRVRRGQEDPGEDAHRATCQLGRLPGDGARRGRGRRSSALTDTYAATRNPTRWDLDGARRAR